MADVITICDLNRYVKSLLDSDSNLYGIALKGEISNFVHHYKSGHYYFSLRDERATVKAVMFRQDANRIAFTPQDGMRVIVRCKVSLYEATGSFQIYVFDMFPDGLGAAQLAFEQLKAKLEQEGLFLPEHKQAIPSHPKTIGVVTSATGAALQDIKNVLQRRWPLVKLLLAPVNVQGTLAAKEIAKAIACLDSSNQADVIIVARGGGSREDLWVFNDEMIARAAFACKTPIISAVGHEIDFSILDFVADLRAPTPSAAAELATPDKEQELQTLQAISMDISDTVKKKLEMCYNSLEQCKLQHQTNHPQRLYEINLSKLETLRVDAMHLAETCYLYKTQQLQHVAQLADSLNPYAVLARGYGLIRNEKGNAITPDSLLPNDTFFLYGHNKKLSCTVNYVEEHKEHINEKAKEF